MTWGVMRTAKAVAKLPAQGFAKVHEPRLGAQTPALVTAVTNLNPTRKSVNKYMVQLIISHDQFGTDGYHTPNNSPLFFSGVYNRPSS